MKGSPLRNIPASVRQRLLNLSRERNEDFGYLLVRYGSERFLYRLSMSRHREMFILKGAMLLQLWSGDLHRPTRDVDLEGLGDRRPAALHKIFREICDAAVDDDGLTFDANSVVAEPIRGEWEYSGTRIKLRASLDSARISLQFDIGFGDAVVPDAIELPYPSLLEFPKPTLRVYPRETVVAEKFEALVRFGMFNGRLKDFYDLWCLARTFTFDGVVLSRAIRATFAQRETAFPADLPSGLSSDFAREHKTQWLAFLKRNRLRLENVEFSEVLATLALFLMPPLLAASSATNFHRVWNLEEGWGESVRPPAKASPPHDANAS